MGMVVEGWELTFLGHTVSFLGICPGRRTQNAYMIVYRSKNLLGRYQETGHLPDCHFEIHLRELE